jgi:hypothetical protein
LVVKKGFEDLAVAVIKQAYRDFLSSNLHGPDAEEFFRNAFAGEEEAVWFEIIGIQPSVLSKGSQLCAL